MDILFLAPQPFFQNRGTPIAVDLLLQAMSKRGCNIDLVTYGEGEPIEYDNVTIHRTPNFSWSQGIRAGFSLKKVIVDIFMVFIVLSLIAKKRYKLIWAVEEMVFLSLLLKFVFKKPYVYDMDSSLAQQMVEQYPSLTPIADGLKFFEGLAIRRANMVVPVCDALAKEAKTYNPEKVVVLQDVSLLEEADPDRVENLRTELGIGDQRMLMYVGNLQPYQGIDLLLDSFALALKEHETTELVIIGGAESDITLYKEKAKVLGIAQKVHLIGPRPVENLADYLTQADILVSPRVKGKNTPMKIYSYLHSGKALLATDMTTHTQLLDSSIAEIADPVPEAYGASILRLVNDANLRSELGAAAHQFIEERFTYEAFCKKVYQLLDWLETALEQPLGIPMEETAQPTLREKASTIAK